MRLFLGIGVLFVGLLGIGYFLGQDRATQIEAKVRASATSALAEVEKSGQFSEGQVAISVEGRDLLLSGMVESDAQEKTLLSDFKSIEGVRVVKSALELPPVITPYVIEMPKGGMITGHVPSAAIRRDLEQRLNQGLSQLDLGRGVPDSAWNDAITHSAALLPRLETGSVRLEDQNVHVDGTVIFESELNDILAHLEALPMGYTPIVGLKVLDDGKPFSLTFEPQDGMLKAVKGKLPADFDPALYPVITRGYAVDAQGAFSNAIDEALGIAGQEQVDTLTIFPSMLALSATVNTPQDADALKEALKAALPAHVLSLQLEVLDDGLPATMAMRHSAVGGTVIGGKLPSDFKSWLAAQSHLDFVALGPDHTDARFANDASAAFIASVDGIAPWLMEFEHLQAQLGDEGLGIEGIATYGVDVAQLENEMRAALPAAQIRLRAADPAQMPDVGARRTNAIGAKPEVFRGAWLPTVDFAPAMASCEEASNQALRAHKINFVTGSSKLDARSMRAINALSAIIYHCSESDENLRLLITGHTDNQGQAAANQKLSEDRAQAVGAALLQRQINGDILRIFGAGDTQPIADNTTAEGRAANRRTSLTWSQVDAIGTNTSDTSQNSN